MNRRSTPEADAQRSIVQALRVALPRDAIVHHCANEVTESGSRGQIRQSILVDAPQHPESLVILAARVVAGQTNSASECADAIDLLCQLDRRPLHTIAAAAFPNGGAA